MAKHAAKHRKRTARTRRAGKLRALSTAGVLVGGLVLAPYSDSAERAAQKVFAEVLLTANGTIIFIDGHNYPDSGTRMAQQLQGQYQYDPTCTTDCTHLTTPASSNNPPVFIQYPAKLGLLDGPGAPTGDQSINAGQQRIHTAITGSQTPVTVVGYSEGAVAASHEVPNWTPGGPVAFVLIADPERPNGGILARFPAGTYIPFLGITGGNATSATGAPVVMVTRQYDGIADAPAYPLNVLADANAFLGFYYLHSTYQSVNPNDPNTAKIVTHSANGNMTDILILAPEGQLPIFMPLAQAGVPAPILVALDPAVRAIIETGYNRTSDPSQQVRFALLPPPSAWPGDVQMVVVGFITTGERLPGAILASVPGAPNLLVLAPLNTMSPVTSPATIVSPASQTQLASRVQPMSPLQQSAVTNQENSPGTDGAQQIASGTAQTIPGTPQDTSGPPVSSLSALSPTTASSRPESRPTTQSTIVDMTTGNMVTPPKLSAPGRTSLNGSNPLQGAVNTVTNVIGSVAGNITHGPSTGTTASQSTSGSAGSG